MSSSILAMAAWLTPPAHGCHTHHTTVVQLTPAQEARLDVRLYQSALHRREANPTVFDKRNPLLGRILTDDRVAARLVTAWQSHRKAFEQNHPRLWRILDGLQQQHDVLHPSQTAPLTIPPDVPHGGSSPDDDPQRTDPSPSPALSPQAVPEPGTMLLLGLGMAFGLRWGGPTRSISGRAI